MCCVQLIYSNSNTLGTQFWWRDNAGVLVSEVIDVGLGLGLGCNMTHDPTVKHMEASNGEIRTLAHL